jgi:6,7-dimethyl-8-ribityllumazine synthase
VPGAYEIPLAAAKLAEKKTVDAVVCLGAVIRGETLHYDLVAQSAAHGIMRASLITGKPVVFGVLATDTIEQADKRSQEKGDNKGRDAAVTALEMINVVKRIAGVK